MKLEASTCTISPRSIGSSHQPGSKPTLPSCAHESARVVAQTVIVESMTSDGHPPSDRNRTRGRNRSRRDRSRRFGHSRRRRRGRPRSGSGHRRHRDTGQPTQRATRATTPIRRRRGTPATARDSTDDDVGDTHVTERALDIRSVRSRTRCSSSFDATGKNSRISARVVSTSRISGQVAGSERPSPPVAARGARGGTKRIEGLRVPPDDLGESGRARKGHVVQVLARGDVLAPELYLRPRT